MKIWLVSEFFYPEEVSTGYLMTKIAEELAAADEVHVICGPSAHQSHILNASYSINESITIHRVSIPQLGKKKIFSRILRMLFLTLAMGFKLATNVRKGDKVVIVTNPPSLLVIVSFLKKIIRFRYFIIVHDVFPENLVPAGILKTKTFLYHILCRVFNFSYNEADKLIVLGIDMRNLLATKLKKNIPIEVIQNWADSDYIYPIPGFDRNAYYGNDFSGKMIFQFAGNIGRAQGLEDFFSIIEKVNNPELFFIFIGDGALKKKLEMIQQKKDIKNILFLNPKARSEQLFFLNACDIGLVTLSPGMYGLGVPSKTYNIMAAGKPIFFIGDEGTELGNYIKEGDAGWEFNWGTTEKCINFLNNLSQSDSLIIKEKGCNAKKLIINSFTRTKILSKFKAALS